MTSINLSFREWPFPLPRKQQPQDFQQATKELLKSQMPSYLFPTQALINVQPKIDTNTETALPSHLTSFGRCGFFAVTNESCLSIFSNDENGYLTPIFMFSPFEKFRAGKIFKQPQKTATISALGWSNGYLQPSFSKQILAVSSEKGHLKIYDFCTKETIGEYRFNEQIVSLLWSSSKQNRFFAGSKSGHFYVCEVYNRKTVEVVKTFDFQIKSSSSSSSEIVFKSIDFISQDDVDGSTVVIASKDGVLGFISNLNDIRKAKLQVYQNFNFKELDDSINFVEFYPNNSDFVTIATKKSTFLISISKGILIPFIKTANCKFISLIDNENDKVIIGDDNELTLWKLVDQSWVRLCNLPIGFKEILTFSKHENKILLTTASNWLTEVEFKRNKIFVTKRIKLIDGKPIDYDFDDGSIAVLTNKNTISLTKKTIESINSIKNDEKQDSSDESSSQAYQSTDDYSDSPFTESEESMTINASSESLKQNFQNNESDDSELSKSESDIFMKNIDKRSFNDSLRGNSNSFVLSFYINNYNSELKHIKMISSKKIVAWCKNSLYLIDLEKRNVTEPLSKKFCKKTTTITQLFFSKNKKIICLILNHKKVYFLDTESNLNIINSIDFTDKIKTNDDYLFGSMSPNDDKVVFSLMNSLFFLDLNEKDSLKEINSILEFKVSFISWRNRGILIGTEKGGACLITNKKIDEIFSKQRMSKKDVKIIYNSNKQKLNAIKSIIPCANNNYIIIDSTYFGFIVSKNNIQSIAENIKSIKQISKDSFLIRLSYYNKLIALNLYNEYISSPPPCYFSIQNNKINLIKSIKDMKYNNELIESISNKINHSISLRNSVQLLNQFISFHDHFNSLSSKTFLKLGNLEKARNLFLNTNPDDKDYLNNMMLAALYNSGSNQNDSVQLVVKNFLNNNLINEAVDILLITKDIYSAAEILFDNGRNKDAYQILMLNNQDNNKDNAKEIVQKIAYSLITKKENVLFGLKLLSSFGYLHEMMNQISLIVL